jgi:hypothetical protein
MQTVSLPEQGMAPVLSNYKLLYKKEDDDVVVNKKRVSCVVERDHAPLSSVYINMFDFRLLVLERVVISFYVLFFLSLSSSNLERERKDLP